MSPSHSKKYSDVIKWDTYSEEALNSLKYSLIDKILRSGGKSMTNQQLSDAFRRDPAILLSDGRKIISYGRGLKLDKEGHYVVKCKVMFNMQTAAKVGAQREYYHCGCSTMDAVIELIPEVDIERTQDKNGKWGFKARLLPDAERIAFRVLEVCQAVRELRDVPPNFKTELCKFHFGKHGCVNGGRCHFAHSKQELRNLAPPSPNQIFQRNQATPAPPAPPTRAPWFRQDKHDASLVQPHPRNPAPSMPPAPPATWFREDKHDASY